MPKHIRLPEEFYQSRPAGIDLRKNIAEFCNENNFQYFKTVQELFDADLHQIDNSVKKLVVVHIFDPMPFGPLQWQQLDQKLITADKTVLVCSDSFVDLPTYTNIKFLSHPALLGLKHFHAKPEWYDTFADTHTPGRLFNCFMHRIEPVRQSWFYFLHNLNLLDRGYVSFLLYDFNNTALPELELFDRIHKQGGLTQLDHFEKAYQELRTKIPFQNFVENSELCDKICDSKYSLVLDTAGPDDHMGSCFISEKVARAVMLPTIDLLFVPKGTLHHLESIGIVTDSLPLGIDDLSWQERQTRLLEALSQDTHEYNFLKLAEKARHNHNTFKKCYQTMDTFYTEVADILTSQ